MSCLLDNLLIFGRVLRRAGIDVHRGRLLDVVNALEYVNLGQRGEVYHACRALLVHRHAQLALFDVAFAAFWREPDGGEARQAPQPGGSRASVVVVEEGLANGDVRAAIGGDGPDDDALATRGGLKTWSDRGGLADKDFAAFTSAETAEAAAILSRLVWSPGERRTRRWIRGRGSRVDLRRTVADSVRTGGDVRELRRRAPRLRRRALVLLCDVSGSMERYVRMLLHFAHAVTRRHDRVEAFLFATQLTRITRQLRASPANAVLAAISRAVPDWSGGTHIAGAVKEFHQRWSRRVLNGGPVVLLVSDGWDRGEPGELRDQIAWLQRSCHRLVWLNPLIGTADYAPLTRGLQAALPFVDDFLPVRTLNNLADLAIHLNALDASRSG
jgi:uncharacterized protein